MCMNIRKIIQSQYLASLDMLKNAIELCPRQVWEDNKPKNKFWHIAYHALFYTHLYLQEEEADFKPWEKHVENLGSLSSSFEAIHKSKEPFSQEDILSYLDFCRDQVITLLPRLDYDSPKSGFHWLPCSKLELQFYNIRHIQQHTGELCERLGTEAAIDVGWVGMIHNKS